MQRLIENLQGKNEHYLFPFFWQHGESFEVIETYMEKMIEQGIHNVCVESRPHPDFLGEGWWETMDFIISKSKELGMKIWILDDAKFPTGYANGKVPEELQKKYLNLRRIDITGSNDYSEVNLTPIVDFREFLTDNRHKDDKVFKVFIAENDPSDKDAYIKETLTDVTHHYNGSVLKVKTNNKDYSVFVLYLTSSGQEEGTKYYLDPMREEATQVLIETVYTKHLEKYGHEFGKTIVGFFSDEPRFGNTKGPNAIVGKMDMPLPWNDNVYKRYQEVGDVDDSDLIKLFIGNPEESRIVRFEYMNIVSQLYSENFSNVLGEWCRDHGLDYVGHIIEDNNAHARLGYGAGHYFRSISGQTMAGIDIIGGQVVPGMDYYHTAFSTGGSDGEFYHYTLVNLGASAAKLDPKKRGRLMCEAFGAYGWIEGLKMMTWITNHMLSHGVNTIVPHAFSLKDFPDWDCPPHFYAGGNDPQYNNFGVWSQRTDRMCNLLSGGHKFAKVGVLYHAFAEWSGEAMLIQKVNKELQQKQISHDIISEDYLLESKLDNGTYIINGFNYEVLIVPKSTYLPKKLMNFLESLKREVRVIFVDETPVGWDGSAEIVELSDLGKNLEKYKDIFIDEPFEKLVAYKYIQNGKSIYLLNNESIYDAVDTKVRILETESYAFYDAGSNKLIEKFDAYDGAVTFNLKLEPYQAIFLVPLGEELIEKVQQATRTIETITEAKVSLKQFNENEFSKPVKYNIEDDLTEKYPNFSGQVQYEFELSKDAGNVLYIERAFETVSLFVNGQEVGVQVAPPYVFNLKGLDKEVNEIKIIVTNTLSRNLKDPFSSFIALEPFGIRTKIEIKK